MTTVLLYGGGDGGGLIIAPRGVTRIPPFDPAILRQLEATSRFVHAAHGVRNKRQQKELIQIATKASNLVVEQLESVVGPLDGDAKVIFDDDDGGFVCGSTGKLPIPIPKPRTIPAIAEAVFGHEIIKNEVIDFGQAIHSRGLKLKDALNDPEGTARLLNANLSAETIQALKSMSPAGLSAVGDPVDKEILEYFHKVLDDGRYVRSWALRPDDVSAAVGAKLSKSAIDRIVVATQGHMLDDPIGTIAISPVVVGIVVVVIMLVPTVAGQQFEKIRDRSVLQKF
jgi:hypothetical protein